MHLFYSEFFLAISRTDIVNLPARCWGEFASIFFLLAQQLLSTYSSLVMKYINVKVFIIKNKSLILHQIILLIQKKKA